jgi:hypothetical protein
MANFRAEYKKRQTPWETSKVTSDEIKDFLQKKDAPKSKSSWATLRTDF